MGKVNNRAPDFKLPIPYIPEDGKEADVSDEPPPPPSQAIARR
jgi:hypothetical protein